MGAQVTIWWGGVRVGVFGTGMSELGTREVGRNLVQDLAKTWRYQPEARARRLDPFLNKFTARLLKLKWIRKDFARRALKLVLASACSEVL